MRISIIPSATNLFMKIRDSSSNGRWKEVLSHYKELRTIAGVQLIDHTIFSHLLKASLAGSSGLGKSTHAAVIKMGFESFCSVGNSIMNFYQKSGALSSALAFFDCMPVRDSVSWNVIIHGHLDQDADREGLELYIQARGTGFEPNISTLVLVVQAYRSLRIFMAGLTFHGYLIRSGLWNLTSVQNSLLSMYSEVSMECANNLFDEMNDKDVISWSIMIQGYIQNHGIILALQSFKQMVSECNIEADGQTMVNVIRGCTNLGDIRIGELVHGFIVVRGLNSDLFVGNTLIDFYCKCNDIDSGVKIFYEMPHVNIVSWNSLLSGFVNHEWYLEALTLFISMGKSGVDADAVTLVNLLLVSKALGDLHQCKLIHAWIIRRCFQSNELAMNSLIDAYGKTCQIELAWRVFCQIKEPDAVTWSTMISCFTHSGMPDEAISIYRDMRRSLELPTPITLLNLLEACAVSAEIRRSKWAHGIAIRMGLASDVVVGTAILDMYSKCGAIKASRRAFDNISSKNIVSWTAIIAACGLNGFAHDALALLSEMKVNSMKPNPVTILSALSACCHGGLVEEGLSVFKELVKEYGTELKLEHYSCLVDLLARAGNIDYALDIIKSIPVGLKSGASGWGALLSACRNHEKREFSAAALSQILKLEPSSSAGYLLASSIYAAGGSWADASGMRCLLKEKSLKVVPGYSLVYVNDKAYHFTAGDKPHRLSHIICPIIEQLHLYMKMNMFPTQFVINLSADSF